MENNTQSDLTVAMTILEQLGGNRFRAMTGARKFGGTANSLDFKLGRNGKNITDVRITLMPSDTYRMEFLKVRAGKVKIASTVEDVYNDSLRAVFTAETGLYTSMSG